MKYEITKGSEEDFEQGPEWAMQVDKCIETGHLFYTENIMGSQSGTDKCKWSNESEVRPLNYSANYEDEGFETIAQRRPITEPVWDGKGLPPVGAQCEIFVGDAGWIKGEVMYNGAKCSLLLDETGEDWFFSRKVAKFRPIRSPEDVARDDVGKGLIEFLDRETDTDNPFKQFELTGFYDFIAAGKIPGVKLV